MRSNYDKFSYLLERCIIDIKINESMISRKEVLPHEKNKVFFDGISFCGIVIFLKCNSTCKRIRSLQTLQRLQGLLLQLV